MLQTKRQSFAREFLVDRNATKAAERAGYSERTAKQDEEDATWLEGLKDRRAFFAGRFGTHGSGSVQPLYGGYAIYGNMLMLSEGANEDEALGNCDALINAIDTPPIR